MLDELENLTSDLNDLQAKEGGCPVVFGHGMLAELNVLADAHTNGFLLFHEGYFQAVPRILSNGSFQHTHQLTLYFFSPSSITDKPDAKRANRDLLMPIYKRVFAKLDAMGTIGGQMADMNFTLNRTDRNMDGIRLKLNLTTEAEPLC